MDLPLTETGKLSKRGLREQGHVFAMFILTYLIETQQSTVGIWI